MSNNVDITLTADSKSAEQALDKMNDRLQKTESRLEKMKKVSKEAGYEGSVGFDRAVQSIDKTAQAALVAVANFGIWKTAAKAVGDEIQRNIKLQESARMAVLGPAQAIREAKLNFVEDETMNAAGLEEAILRVAQKTSAPIGNVAVAFKDALSAKGSLSNAKVEEAVLQVMRADPAATNSAAVLSGGVMDIAKFSGSDDMRSTFGFLLNLQSAARITDPAKVGQNLVPAVAGLTNFGNSPEQAGELITSLTQLGFENKGEVAATAALQLGTQLDEFRLARGKKGAFKGQLVGKDADGEFAVPDEQYAKFREAKSTMAQLQTMWESPELARAFMGGSSFEQKMKQPIFQMVRGDEKARAELEQAQQVVKPIDRMQAIRFEGKIGELNSGPAAAQLNADMRRESATEMAKFSNVNRQRIASARKTLEDTLGNVNMPGIDDMPLIGGKQPLMAAFESAMLVSEEKLSRGEKVMPPEDVAASLLEKLPRKGGKFSGDMSPLDQKYVDTQIQGLKKEAGAQGSMKPDRDPQMEEQTALLRQLVSAVKDGKQGGSMLPKSEGYTPRAAAVSREMRAGY